jgi:two-component system nitrate/nitrite response regulator NarL
MVAVLVCDDQLLFGEALAAALRRRGAPAVAVPDLAALTQLDEAGAATHVVVGAEPARPEAARDVEQVRQACPEAVLVCLTADTLTAQDSWILEAADVAVSKRQPLADVVQAVLGHPGDGQRRESAARPAPGRGGSRREDVRSLPARFLTARERQVLHLLVVGESTQGIARRLGVARSTARSHVQAVLGRLAVHSRVEAVRYALFHDLVDVDGYEGRGERTSD